MGGFVDHEDLQRTTRDVFERGGVLSSVRHGYCGLLNVKLSDRRTLTGYSWTDEVLAGVAKKVPYNCEAEMKQRGATYKKSMIPFTSFVVVEDRLVTGQNPGSA